jgi:Holliday junction resolvase RusA-like endonuclease
MIAFTVPFRFRAKANSYRAGKGRFYVDPVVKTQQEEARRIATAAMGGNVPSLNAISITITITVTNKRRFDIDGCLKSLLDALNGIVWKDDSQITELKVSKRLSKEAAHDTTDIEIKEL